MARSIDRACPPGAYHGPMALASRVPRGGLEAACDDVRLQRWEGAGETGGRSGWVPHLHLFLISRCPARSIHSGFDLPSCLFVWAHLAQAALRLYALKQIRGYWSSI